MKYLKSVTGLLLLLCLMSANSFAEITIGVLAKRGPEVVQERWSSLGEKLSQELGQKVVFKPLKFVEIDDFCENDPGSYLFANSWLYVKAKHKYGAKAIATMSDKHAGPYFGGVIFVRKNSPIKNLSDLKGKKLMCAKFSSAGGWLFQKDEIINSGINPEKDLELLLEGKTHDEVVYAVKDGRVDVGTVRTNILERMQREGKISMDEFRILNQKHYEEFPEVVSTPLYPEWPIAALKSADPAISQKLKYALLSIPADDKSLQNSNVDKFIDPLNYHEMEALLKRLNIEPFRVSRKHNVMNLSSDTQ